MKIEKETISCNFCGSSKFTKYDQIGKWTIVKCKECGFCYTNPRPKEEFLPVFYTEDYFQDIRHRKRFYEPDGSIKLDEGNYLNRIIEIENYFDNRGVLLEIGAARGGFLKKMQDRGWEVFGVEISEDAVELAKQVNNLRLFCGNFISYHLNNHFDVICMYQTLEHLPEPKEILKKAFTELKPNGILVIEVPNIKGWDIMWNKREKELVYDLPRHLNHFSPLLLKKELNKLGFEIIDIDRYYPNFILKYFNRKNKKTQNNKIFNKDKREEESLPMKRKNKTWKLKLLDMISIIFPGWRFTIIARKVY